MAINVPPDFIWPNTAIPKPAVRTNKEMNKSSSVSLGKLMQQDIEVCQLTITVTNTTAISNQPLSSIGSIIAGNTVFGEHLSFKSYNELTNYLDRPSFLRSYNDCIYYFIAMNKSQ